MTYQQKAAIEQIIIEIISITLSYANNDIPEEFSSKIHNIYKNAKCNITKSYYAEINNLIDQQISNNLSEKEKRQQIQEYIVAISETIAIASSDNNFKNLIKYIGSYINIHVRTYSSMINGIEETMKVQEEYNKQIKNAKKELSNSKNQLIKTKDTINNLLPNLLTVLSILISIVIAVVIVYITVFLENNRIPSVVKEFVQARFAQYVLCIHVVGDLFFLMMFMIARLTNRSILMTCSYFNWKSEIPDEYKDSYTTEFHRFACADCSTDCSFIKKLQRKSAYIIYFNVLMVALYACFYIWWIFDYYINGEKEFLFTGDFWFLISIGCISLLIALFLILKKLYINHVQKVFVEKLSFNKCVRCYDCDSCMFENKIHFKTLSDIKKSYKYNEYTNKKYKSYNSELKLLNIKKMEKRSEKIEYTWEYKNRLYIFLYNINKLDNIE